MKITKILNNNVVTSIDENTSLEEVIMGRGIAFGKKIGDLIESDKIEKIFSIQNKMQNKKFQELVNKIPLKYINASEKIISYAKETLKLDLDEHIYISLTDHLAFAIKRAISGINIKNELLWELKRIHKKEYEIGLWAIEYIKKTIGIDLHEDEAGFIALHIINASMTIEDRTNNNAMEITNIIKDIINIIKYHFTIEFNEEDLSYDRLLTHLKYFAKRIVLNEQAIEDEITFLNIIKENYKNAYNCALKIKAYIKRNYNYEVNNGEIVYLSMHLQRLIDNYKIK